MKRLSDELLYVHNRQKQKNFIGNTLDKPGIFLARKKLKETTEKERIL